MLRRRPKNLQSQDTTTPIHHSNDRGDHPPIRSRLSYVRIRALCIVHAECRGEEQSRRSREKQPSNRVRRPQAARRPPAPVIVIPTKRRVLREILPPNFGERTREVTARLRKLSAGALPCQADGAPKQGQALQTLRPPLRRNCLPVNRHPRHKGRISGKRRRGVFKQKLFPRGPAAHFPTSDAFMFAPHSPTPHSFTQAGDTSSAVP